MRARAAWFTRERAQLQSGLKPLAYWLGNLVYDFTLYMGLVSCVYVIYLIKDVTRLLTASVRAPS